MSELQDTGRGAGQRGEPVLITGTSSGLGLEMAVYLAERGFRVYATMRDLERRGRLDEEARRRNVELEVLQLDVTDRDSIEAAVRTIVDGSGPVFGLVNNAGIPLRGYFEDLSEAEIRTIFETNLFGTMAVTRAVLPSMRAAGRGRIVMISSVAGRMGSPGLSAYCAVKHALEGLGESLALEMVPLGVHVSVVTPAIIKTPIWSSNRQVSVGAQDPDSPYYDWFWASEKVADDLVQTTPTKPVDVASTVYRALTAGRPRIRYLVGRRAGLVIGLRGLVPGALFERIWVRETIRRIEKFRQAPGGEV